MKAEKKVRASKELKQESTVDLETRSPEDLQEEKRSVAALARQMKNHLPEMEKDQRDALLTELYRMSIVKQVLDSQGGIERADAEANLQLFRKYRLWLVKVDNELIKAMMVMHVARDIAKSNPQEKNSQNELETLIVSKTLTAIDRVGKELEKAIALVKHLQYDMAAGIHPTKRTDAERALVLQEPKGLEHTTLPLSPKTKEFDHWFIRKADSILEKYRTKDGKPIPRHDKVISKLLKFALGEHRSDDNVRKALSPARRKPS